MKNLLVILGVLVTVALIGQALSGYFVVDDFNITCPSDIEILYFYQPTCSHCAKVAPLIDSLVSNGCNITKINVMEDPTIAINYNVSWIPTVIVGNERIVGEFTASQLQELINN